MYFSCWTETLFMFFFFFIILMIFKEDVESTVVLKMNLYFCLYFHDLMTIFLTSVGNFLQLNLSTTISSCLVFLSVALILGHESSARSVDSLSLP